jgi:hypothetical protein
MHMAGAPVEQHASVKSEVAIEATMEQKIASMSRSEVLAWMRTAEGRSATAAQKAAALHKAGLTDEHGRWYHMMDQNEG